MCCASCRLGAVACCACGGTGLYICVGRVYICCLGCRGCGIWAICTCRLFRAVAIAFLELCVETAAFLAFGVSADSSDGSLQLRGTVLGTGRIGLAPRALGTSANMGGLLWFGFVFCFYRLVIRVAEKNNSSARPCSFFGFCLCGDAPIAFCCGGTSFGATTLGLLGFSV